MSNNQEENETVANGTARDDISSCDALVKLSNYEADAAVKRLQKFIQFETVSSLAVKSGAYVDCANWLCEDVLKPSGIFNDVFMLPEAPDHSPVVIAKLIGIDNDTLPVLLLNSHYDVVPAESSDWSVPPFDGIQRDDRIYGRGTQDMKCVCLQYIEALIHIKRIQPNWIPARSIYLSFVPDEEVGGGGMASLLQSEWYKNLPGAGIALALDEGLASTSDVFSIFYGERLPWWVDVTATGPTGHGSRFIDNTAVEQLLAIANKALEFRSGQRALLGLDDHSNCAHVVAAKATAASTSQQEESVSKTLGDVTSLNITTLQAGVRVGDTYAYNCVPPIAKCSLDIRISPHVEPSTIGTMLDTWCRECSSSGSIYDGASTLSWDYITVQGNMKNDAQKHAITSMNENDNPWYSVFVTALKDIGMSVQPQVFPAATDSRFLRALGIRAFGFSPMRNVEILLHENDEYIPIHTYLEGISIYIHLLKVLGDAANL